MKHQGTSQLVSCEICGIRVRARGLKSHLRLFHKLKLNEVTKVVMTQVKDEKPPMATQVTPTQVMTQVTTPDLTQVAPVKIVTEVREVQRSYYSIETKCDGCGKMQSGVQCYNDVFPFIAHSCRLHFCPDCLHNQEITDRAFTKNGCDYFANRDAKIESIKLKYGGEVVKLKNGGEITRAELWKKQQ